MSDVEPVSTVSNHVSAASTRRLEIRDPRLRTETRHIEPNLGATFRAKTALRAGNHGNVGLIATR